MSDGKAFRTANVIVLTVFLAVTLIFSLSHEPWYDELQAWQIVKYNDLGGILRQMNYEGHPLLWYAVLIPFVRLGMPCGMMPLISWSFTAVTSALLVFRSPFEMKMKLAVLFSGGFLYYNSVMSRVYCLIPLLLFLTAELYPKRKERPILFGVLVALLANTHIMMCGLVGALGIFMLADLYSEWKSPQKKSLWKPVLGLAAAGAGVVLLVVPLLGSVSSNSFTSEGIDLGTAVSNFFNGFGDIAVSASDPANLGFGIFLSGILALVMVMTIIALFGSGRPFVMSVLFALFQLLISSFVYPVPNANRGTVFITVFVFVLWIAKDNGFTRSPIADKLESAGTESRLIVFLAELAGSSGKLAERLTVLLLVCTVPSAVWYGINDTIRPFSRFEETAEWIENNLPEDSVLAADSPVHICVGAYLPDSYRIYSESDNCFVQYDLHRKSEGAGDSSKTASDLSDLEHVYRIRYTNYDDFVPTESTLFSAVGSIPYSANVSGIYIEEAGL